MSCERFREAIAGHAAGAELGPPAAVHVAGCETCAAQLEMQRRLLTEVDAELERALAIVASPDLVAGVTARLRPSDPRPGTWRPSAVWIGLAAAAAFAAAAFLRAPATTAPAAPSASSAATAPAAPLATAPATVQPLAPRVARRPVAVRRSAGKGREPLAARPDGAPPVIVDAAQVRAIARLRELLMAGRLNEKMLPPARAHEPTELTISPLEIPEITVPDVEAIGRAPGTPPERQ